MFQIRIANLNEIQGALVNKGNEPSGFIKLSEFPDYMRTYKVFKKDSVPWN
jgi:hypothetical protein